jgi:PAS domain-containing protein
MSHSFNKYGVSAAYFHCAWLLLEAVVCNYKRLNDTEERFQYCSDFQETWCQISIVHGLQVQLPGGEHMVDVTVQTLRDPAALDGMTIIVFQDIASLPSGRRARTGKTPLSAADADALQNYRDEIQRLRDESRASKEELQSSNEELQSTNEELQSTNEELTTSKEEMQSMNEELQTINVELQSKLDALALAQSDMQNLLNGLDIAILFLDQDLNVRRYTDQASSLINLRESDVGRPLSDLTTSLHYPDLHQDALKTLRTLEVSERQVRTDEHTWFSVRIIPYRTLENVIDGVAITLVDITSTKELEASLRRETKAPSEE